MAISSITIKNFKGVGELTDFKLAPLTLFIGPNSSGKSSCIHGIAALAQTVKIADPSRSIVLDDDFAQVHLGRFIEIIHSNSYNDSFELGIEVSDIPQLYKRALGFNVASLKAVYSFKCSKRTQEIFIDKGCFELGEYRLEIIRTKSNVYKLIEPTLGREYIGYFLGGFQFEIDWLGNDDENWRRCTQIIRLVNRSISNELRKTFYLGPFRQSPLRRYPYKGATPNEVGPMGEAAISLLANEYIATTKRTHHKQISAWLEELGLAKKLQVSRVGSSDLFDLSITLSDNNSLPIADLGYGLSQILPVLVQCSFARPGSTLLFEQPELHLHPGAGRKLAKVFTNAIAEKDVKIIAETHSPELFNEIFNEIRAGRIDPEDVVAYDVKRENGQSWYQKIEIEVDEDGNIDPSHPWGRGLR